MGLLFLGLYFVDVVHGERGRYGYEIGQPLATMAYHASCSPCLVAATFIDYDLFVIPGAITTDRGDPGDWPGGTESSSSGPPSAAAATAHVRRVLGWRFRFAGRRGSDPARQGRRNEGVRREAMGFGDVTLMAMIGAFLGWQAAILSLLRGGLFGLAHALWKLSFYSRNGRMVRNYRPPIANFLLDPT